MKQITLLLLTCTLCVSGLLAQLTEVNNFGTNPGNLTMYEHVPSNINQNAPVVLVMHGCGQLANDFANETGWNDIADQYGFYVIHAGQSTLNNGTKCFNWFSSFDYTRDLGEAMSLAQMVDYMHSNYSTNTNRTYVCGLSAGGSMTSVMMAAYPDKFHKAGIWAGVPFRFSTLGSNNKTPQEWGDFVRNAYSYNGTYPKLFICQGTNDNVVDPLNEGRLVDQWTNVHGVDQQVDYTNTSFQGNTDVTQKLYQDNSLSDTIVITYTVNNMAHGIAVDPGNGAMQGGETSSGAFDVNFFSTYWMADFFGLLSTPTAVNEENHSNSIIFNVTDGNLLVNSTDFNDKTVSVYSFSGQLLVQKEFTSLVQLNSSIFAKNANYIAVVHSNLGVKLSSFVFSF
jgi:poly(hydroxyalkanoate) depolymerase family esterase